MKCLNFIHYSLADLFNEMTQLYILLPGRPVQRNVSTLYITPWQTCLMKCLNFIHYSLADLFNEMSQLYTLLSGRHGQ